MTTRRLARSTIRFPEPVRSTAPEPAEERGLRRDQVRLLVASDDGVTAGRFHDLPEHLRPGDLVVVNNSATVAAQLDGISAARGRVIVHLATPLDDGSWVIELRSAPDAGRAILDGGVGEQIRIDDVTLTLNAAYPYENSSPRGEGNRLWRAAADGDVAAAAAAHGRPIAYGYLDRAYPLSRYQTAFSTIPGSAEMPSAARPFTPEVVTALIGRGIALAGITLHTGVSSQEAGEGPQAERFAVPEVTARLVNATRAAGGRVVAVGTTVTRALESAVTVLGVVEPAQGWTDRVVTPDQPPQVVDGLVTGWHDPNASHLLLVEAVAGRELAQRAYDAAVAAGFLWHEFGDSALLLP